MSENEEERPLTRREIRLREMAAAERDHESTAQEDAASPQEDATLPQEDASVEDDIVISPVNEDGSLRSRRELRELRAQALAERKAQRSAESEDAAGSESADQSDTAVAPEAVLEPEAVAESDDEPGDENAIEPAAEQADEPTLDAEREVDAPLDAPTQPFTVQDLREAEQRSEDAASDADADADADADEGDGDGDGESTDSPVEEREAEDPSEANADGEAVTDAPTVAMTLDSLPADVEETDDRPLDVAEEAAAVDEIVSEEDADSESSQADAPSQNEKEDTGYSFPNIEPPEEWRSVFDDPSTRVVPTTPSAESTPTAGEDFDDLISRAVVQEGSTGGSGASALILPSMPDDAGLTGTLGGTGELFVTGSIDVPKSIGETGGHASLHDSIEVDPMDDLSESPAELDPRDSGPVSARRAVSAMAQTGVPAPSEVKQDQSTLPRILLFTGGGLIVVIGGLVIWGATNGFFG